MDSLWTSVCFTILLCLKTNFKNEHSAEDNLLPSGKCKDFGEPIIWKWRYYRAVFIPLFSYNSFQVLTLDQYSNSDVSTKILCTPEIRFSSRASHCRRLTRLAEMASGRADSIPRVTRPKPSQGINIVLRYPYAMKIRHRFAFIQRCMCIYSWSNCRMSLDSLLDNLWAEKFK